MKWLRKFDKAAGRWTNQCWPYNEVLAREEDMRLVTEEEAKACLVALAMEKRAAIIARMEKRAVENPIIVPSLNKAVEVPPPAAAKGENLDIKAVAENPKPLTPEEIESNLNKKLADPEPLKMALDDLDDMSKLELQNVIDIEALKISKIGNKAELMGRIREGRKAKASAPSGMEAVKAQSDAAIESVKG